MILPNGAVKIIDRKKNIFKLEQVVLYFNIQGEYIAPEKIENIIGKSVFTVNTFVYGDSYKSYLVALVVPDEAFIKKWSEAQCTISL